MVGALEEDSIRVLLQMTEDLIAGMSVDEVAEKDYKMVVEYNYWTSKECVPTDDPHWSVINILNDDKYFKWKVADDPEGLT